MSVSPEKRFYSEDVRRKALDVFNAMDTDRLLEVLTVTPSNLKPRFEEKAFEESLRENEATVKKTFDTSGESKGSQSRISEKMQTKERPQYTAGTMPRGKAPGTAAGEGSESSSAPRGYHVGGARGHLMPKIRLKHDASRGQDWDTSGDGENEQAQVGKAEGGDVF